MRKYMYRNMYTYTPATTSISPRYSACRRSSCVPSTSTWHGDTAKKKIDIIQMTLNEEVGRACLPQTSRVERPCQVAQYPQQRHCNTFCNTLQHTATHCNTLQHTATFEWHSTHNKGTWHGGMVKKIYQVSVLLHVPYPSL